MRNRNGNGKKFFCPNVMGLKSKVLVKRIRMGVETLRQAAFGLPSTPERQAGQRLSPNGGKTYGDFS
jgi:hypothetical protein